MPFGGADNSRVDPDALPSNESGIINPAGSLEEQLAKLFADAGDDSAVMGNGASSRDTSRDEETDTEPGQPGAQPSSQPEVASTDAPTQESGAGEGEAVAPSQPDTPTPHPNTADTPPPASPAESDLDILEFQGRQITRAQAKGLLSVLEWASSNPQQAAVVDAYMQGTVQFDPTAGRLIPTNPQQPGQQQPNPVPTTQAPAADPYAALPPETAERIRAMETVLQYNTQQQEAERANVLRQQQQSDATAIETGVREFQARYALSDEQTQLLTTVAAQANILPGIRNSSPDMKAAIGTVLEMTFWATPQFREAELNRQASAITNQQTKQTKQSNLIGAAGGVGSAPKKVDSAPSRPRDRNERDKMMADELATHLATNSN